MSWVRFPCANINGYAVWWFPLEWNMLHWFWDGPDSFFFLHLSIPFGRNSMPNCGNERKHSESHLIRNHSPIVIFSLLFAIFSPPIANQVWIEILMPAACWGFFVIVCGYLMFGVSFKNLERKKWILSVSSAFTLRPLRIEKVNGKQYGCVVYAVAVQQYENMSQWNNIIRTEMMSADDEW